MAKSSGFGELIGWGIVGVGVYWLGSANNWFGLFGGSPATTPAATTAAATTTATTAANTPPASVSLAGPVTATINNALKANVSINGTVQNLSVIPGGGAYNTAGVDVTASLAALGVTPAQIYSLMQAAYASQQAGSKTTTTTTTTNLVHIVRPVVPISQRTGVRGVGALVGSSRINYVRKPRFS